MKHVAVTGATVFIGYRLAARLVRHGASVRGLVRLENTRCLPDGVTRFVTALDTRALATALAGVDTVVHLAGVTRARTISELTAVNVGLTRRVAAAACERDAHLVHVSSQAAAGIGTLERPATEQDAPAPITPYGTSKLRGEDVVRGMPSLRWTILRPAAVYGPSDRAFLIGLEKDPPAEQPPYDDAFVEGRIPPVPLNRHSISQLFLDSLAISVWKSAGGARWALRVNPSSGNLHPTEGYLICGSVDGLCAVSMVCHYAPKEHALSQAHS